MYTKKDLIEDFDFLARKCHTFKNILLSLSLDKEEYSNCFELNFKYYNQLLGCFVRLTDKYKPYFSELEKYKSYSLCDSELQQIYAFLSVN